MSRHNALWESYVERLRWIHGAGPTRARRPATVGAAEAEAARRAEWTARPPGRLGRRLLRDVEPYLAFFAIARS
jgi:hypothetical protein